mmetsp:Transcript_20022/g.41879  ORF Transcript_20022/g.41879 Transcript_20022/m.41879 type:complete len:135 (-) Transcript_20022:28-432(-)
MRKRLWRNLTEGGATLERHHITCKKRHSILKQLVTNKATLKYRRMSCTSEEMDGMLDDRMGGILRRRYHRIGLPDRYHGSNEPFINWRTWGEARCWRGTVCGGLRSVRLELMASIGSLLCLRCLRPFLVTPPHF